MRDLSGLYLRNVTIDDKEQLFEWANDPDSRKNAFDEKKITYSDHEKWFDEMMKDIRQEQYILMDEDKPIGQIRLSIEEGAATIDYSIAPEYRGEGYGGALISLIKKKVKYEREDIIKLVAEVKSHNIISQKCFENNGFEEYYTCYKFDIIKDDQG